MKKVPYEPNRGGCSCALSCYTMAARYLWPEDNINFEQMAKIADYHTGYVAWGFAVWLWMVERGAKIIDYDIIDYEAWAKEGLVGYEKSVSPEHFTWVVDSTFDIDKDTENLKLLSEREGFKFIKKKITWTDVQREFKKPGICDITINSRIINGMPGFSMHRVILLDITNDEAVFHDPAGDGSNRSNRRELLEKFKHAFYDIPDGAELCRYSLPATAIRKSQND